LAPRIANAPFMDGKKQLQALKVSRHEVDASMHPAAIDESVRMALVTAGYRAGEARVAVEKARPHVGVSATLEQVLREALRQCASSVAIHRRLSTS